MTITVTLDVQRDIELQLYSRLILFSSAIHVLVFHYQGNLKPSHFLWDYEDVSHTYCLSPGKCRMHTICTYSLCLCVSVLLRLRKFQVAEDHPSTFPVETLRQEKQGKNNRMTESEIRDSQSQSEQVGVSINMPSSASMSAETNQKNRLDPSTIRSTGLEDTSMEGDDDVFLPNGNGHIYHERAAFLFNSKVPVGARSSRLQPTSGARGRRRVLCVLAVVALAVVVLVLVLGISLGVGLYLGAANSGNQGALGRNGSAMADTPHGNSDQSTNPRTPVLKSLRAFWEPGDSRLFEARFLNGSVLTAFGHKTHDGSVASFFSVLVSDGHGSETIVRFPGRRSFASVLLANGTMVNFDWASNFGNLECKVFRKQPRQMHKRGAPAAASANEGEMDREPLFYLQSVPLEEFSNMFRELSTVIAGTFHQGPQTPSQGDSSADNCPPRVPVRVTKCGAQYAYEAAFLQGEVRYEGEEPFVVAPLPWMQETATCGDSGGSNPPNYFLPLSRGRPTGQGAYLPYCTSTSRAFARLCSVMSHTTRQAVSAMCSAVAARVVGGSGYSAIAAIVEESCHEIYNSLRLVCLALTGYDVNPTTADPKHPVRLEAIMKDKLCSARTLVVPPVERGRVTLKVVSYCPGSDPDYSSEQTMDLSIMNGSEFYRALIHINCKGSPEVTYMFLGHSYGGVASSSAMLDRVHHRLQVCSMCAYGMTLSVKVTEDSICCNDTCARDRKCAGHVPQAPREEKTFTEHNSVYCHDFLSDFEVEAPQLPETCVGTCHSRLGVQLRMEDTEQGLLHYDQTLDCVETSNPSCKKVIGT